MPCLVSYRVVRNVVSVQAGVLHTELVPASEWTSSFDLALMFQRLIGDPDEQIQAVVGFRDMWEPA